MIHHAILSENAHPMTPASSPSFSHDIFVRANSICADVEHRLDDIEAMDAGDGDGRAREIWDETIGLCAQGHADMVRGAPLIAGAFLAVGDFLTKSRAQGFLDLYQAYVLIGLLHGAIIRYARSVP